MAPRFYTDTHEWIEIHPSFACIGLSRFAQAELGEILYVALPPVGQCIQAGSELCVLESLKAAAEIYAPVSLTVLECNPELSQRPALLNEDPEGAGWLVKVQLEQPLDTQRLLGPERYLALIQ